MYYALVETFGMSKMLHAWPEKITKFDNFDDFTATVKDYLSTFSKINTTVIL